MNSITSINAKRRIELNEILNSSRNKSIFVSAVTILLLIILIVFGILPAFRSVISQYNENKLIQKTIDDANRKIDVIENLRAEQEEKADSLEIFNETLPEEVVQGPTIDQLYQFAGGNVYISSITFPEEFPKMSTTLLGVTEKVKNVRIVLKADGTQRSLKEFINNIEKSPKVFNIITMNLNRKSEDQIQVLGFEKEFEISITLEYYYWADTTAI